MNKPLSETHPSMMGVLKLRRFSDYSNYLMSEEDPRWDDFADKEVVPTSHVQKHTTDNAVLRAEIDSVICDLLLFCKSEAEKAAAKAVGKGLTRVLGLDQDGDT